MSINTTVNTLILTKKYYNSERHEKAFDPNQFKILSKKKQKSKSTEENTERESTGEKTERELQKPLWFEINRKELEELTRDIYNNQDNDNFKININKRTYDLKNAKKFWMGVTTSKISKSEVKKLSNELIQKRY